MLHENDNPRQAPILKNIYNNKFLIHKFEK